MKMKASTTWSAQTRPPITYTGHKQEHKKQIDYILADEKTNWRVVEEETGILELRVQHGDHFPVRATYDFSDALWPDKEEGQLPRWKPPADRAMLKEALDFAFMLHPRT